MDFSAGHSWMVFARENFSINGDWGFPHIRKLPNQQLIDGLSDPIPGFQPPFFWCTIVSEVMGFGGGGLFPRLPTIGWMVDFMKNLKMN